MGYTKLTVDVATAGTLVFDILDPTTTAVAENKRVDVESGKIREPAAACSARRRRICAVA